MAPRYSVILSTLLLCSAGGCGDGGAGPDPDPDQAPQVFLESMDLEGTLQDRLRVAGFAEDDRSLKSLEILVDGEQKHTQPLHGIRGAFSVLLPKTTAGSHQLRLEVSDAGGHKGHTTTQFTVPDPVPIYDATIYMMRHDKIEPAGGVEFCLAEFCTTTDAAGKAVLTDFLLRGAYDLQFIEGAHPQFLVALGENRLDKNIINLTPEEAIDGKKPTDSSVTVGVNERHIIFIDPLTVPVQELPEQFQNTNYPRNKKFLPPTLELEISTLFTTPSTEYFDGMVAAVHKGVAFANAMYEELPYKDPQTLVIERVEYVAERTIPSWGIITIMPRETGTNRASFFDPRSEGMESIQLSMNVGDHPHGLEGVEYYVETFTGALLSGVLALADGSYDRVRMSHHNGTDPNFFDREWSVKDRQIALLNIMFDQNSLLIPPGEAQ